VCVAAIYGSPFLDAARSTGQLFQASLFEAVINDDLSGMVLFAGSFLAGVAAGLVGAAWAAAADAEGYVLLGVLSFLVGFAVALLAMGVIRSAVTTTFVAWASDPQALARNRPVEFQAIIDAASGKYQPQDVAQYNGQPQPQQHA
jgi:hypothetical protein